MCIIRGGSKSSKKGVLIYLNDPLLHVFFLWTDPHHISNNKGNNNDTVIPTTTQHSNNEQYRINHIGLHVCMVFICLFLVKRGNNNGHLVLGKSMADKNNKMIRQKRSKKVPCDCEEE